MIKYYDMSAITRKVRDAAKDSLDNIMNENNYIYCLLYTSPSPRDVEESRMPSSA